MRRSLRMAACGVLILCSGLAVAQQEGEEAPDILVPKDNKRAQKKEDFISVFELYSNRILVMYYWSSLDPQSLDYFATLNNLEEKYGPKGVTILGIARQNRETVGKIPEERGATFDMFYGGLYGRSWRFPAPRTAYIIDAHRRIAFARFDPTDPRENLEEKIQAVLDKTPTLSATPELLQKNEKKLADFIAQKDFGRAYTLAKAFKDYFRDKADAGQEEQIDETLRQISVGAVELLESARQDLKAENNEEAAHKLASLSVRLTGLENDKDKKGKGKRPSRSPSAGKRGRTQQQQTERGKSFREIKEDVEREIGRMESDNYTKAIVLKALDNVRGEVRIDQAAECMDTQQYSEARELYRSVVEDFTGTAAAESAQQVIDRIEKDPEMRKAVAKAEATEQANRWYDLGDRYARADMFDKAREYFEKVIKEYPTSAAAQKATGRLAHLADEEKTSREGRQKREQPKQATSEKKDSKP